jgi:hypothetical protein
LHQIRLYWIRLFVNINKNTHITILLTTGWINPNPPAISGCGESYECQIVVVSHMKVTIYHLFQFFSVHLKFLKAMQYMSTLPDPLIDLQNEVSRTVIELCLYLFSPTDGYIYNFH